MGYGMDELIYYLLSILIAPFSLDNIKKKFPKNAQMLFQSLQKKSPKNDPSLISIFSLGKY